MHECWVIDRICFVAAGSSQDPQAVHVSFSSMTQSPGWANYVSEGSGSGVVNRPMLIRKPRPMKSAPSTAGTTTARVTTLSTPETRSITGSE